MVNIARIIRRGLDVVSFIAALEIIARIYLERRNAFLYDLVRDRVFKLPPAQYLVRLCRREYRFLMLTKVSGCRV